MRFYKERFIIDSYAKATCQQKQATINWNRNVLIELTGQKSKEQGCTHVDNNHFDAKIITR